MALRVCLVTPFSWSQPHDVNEHVDGVARRLRLLGHEVTVLAPSGRARDLLEGRRAIVTGETGKTVAVGPAVPISRRSSMGVPVGVRANLALALARGGFDVVHGFEPGLPSLSYLALTSTHALTAATFFSPDRLAYPPRRSRRDRLRARVDALLATSAGTAEAAGERFEGDYTLIPVGVDSSLFRPHAKRQTIALELEPGGGARARAVARLLRELPGWELTLLHTKPLGFRPPIPRAVRKRVHVRAVRHPEQRAAALGEAAIFVPAAEGEERLGLEAAAAGAAVVSADGTVDAEVARLAADADARSRLADEGQALAAAQSFDQVAEELDALYARLVRKPHRRSDEGADPLAGRDWIVVDLHTHTDWSHDCATPVTNLLDRAQEIGLGAIAVTDHNAFGGALEAVALARDRDLVVIPGEEVKTDGQGEVIGLFLREEIPRGMSFADTIAAIREQGGLVYLPHPFDRMHTIPDPATLHRHLAEIDVFEVFNARLLRDSFNDEALRFARKYRLLEGAGSDAHVLQGVGTGAVRLRRFDGPEEFLLSLRTAEVLRRPKSLAYLQSLKWAAQVKEKVR
jgi:predicted metal-dependent phosphoesterase TrpH/glycosyltransferase involved in cell wall biosynthesis